MREHMTASTENNGRGMVFVASGVVSGTLLVKQTKKNYSPDVIGQLRYQIIDLRDVERMDITTEQIKQLAMIDREAARAMPGAKIAIVACHDLTVGISRIYRAYAQSPELDAEIFPTLEEARAWVEDGSSHQARAAR